MFNKKVRNIAWAIQAARRDLASANPEYPKYASEEFLNICEAVAIVWVHEPMTGNDGLKKS